MDLIEQQKITAGEFKRHPWELARSGILFYFLKKLRGRKRLLLDIGSGDAFIAKTLAARYPDCTIAAVDSNYDDVFIAANRNGFKNLFLLKNPEDLPAAERAPASMVIMMDVLEHVHEPGALLQNILSSGLVSAETYFFITVPAFQFLHTEHDTFLGHVRRYNRSELHKELKKAGFRILESGYFFTSLFPLRVLRKMREKISGPGKNNGLHNWTRGNFETSVFTYLLKVDFKFCRFFSRLGIHLPGLSCYCLCHPLS